MPPSPEPPLEIRGERGTVLVVTVVAMLILGILAISFAALGNLEVRIGLNDVWDKQATFVAEAGIAAVRNQLQGPADYSPFYGHEYWCDTSSCSCSGSGCGSTRLAPVSTGEFRVRVHDPIELSGPVPTDSTKVVLTARGLTNGPGGNVMGRARLRAWVAADDPWKHVCASGDGTLCTDPPNNPNANITPPDPNNENGPRTYTQIPVPNEIRTTPCPLIMQPCPLNIGAPYYPVPAGVTVPGAPRGPSVMYPYYLTALTTPCLATPAGQCHSTTATMAYDPATCNTGEQCLGMVRMDDSVSLQSGTGGGGAKIVVPGAALGAPGNGNGVTVYILGKVDLKTGVNLYGTLVFHGGGDAGSNASATDLHFQGPHTVATVGPACPTCSYPMAILGYNPNEAVPPGQTIYLDISNANIDITGLVYTGGTVGLGPNTINGSIVAYSAEANTGNSTNYTYNKDYENATPPALPPPGFSPVALTLPSVIARGTWLQCRTAQNLTDPCN